MGGHTWWQCFRIVPGAVLSIESKNGVRISKNKKMQFFCILSKSGKYPKGGPLEKKKIQSSPIWTKLAGLVGTIKKISWVVILKFACTLLGSERPKTKNDAKGVPLEQKKNQSAPIWTKLAGLVGGIKKISWVVILKCSCTLLRSEGSKKKVFVTKSGGFCSKIDFFGGFGRKFAKGLVGSLKLGYVRLGEVRSGGFEEKSILRHKKHQKWK